jgi:hypothetical protein
MPERNNNWPDPVRLGAPLNPEQDSEGHVWRVDGVMEIYKWVASKQWYEDQRGFWVAPDQLIADGDEYFGRIVTPAEVEARVKEARRDALEEAAQFVETHTYVTTNSALKHKLVPYARAKRGLRHVTIAAAIRALKGEGDE